MPKKKVANFLFNRQPLDIEVDANNNVIGVRVIKHKPTGIKIYRRQRTYIIHRCGYSCIWFLNLPRTIRG